MLCPRCGAELFPGMTQCPECGSSAYGNAYRTASVTVTAREARQGVFKTVNLPQLTGPLRFRVKPGTKNGAQIMVNNAAFKMPEGGTMLIPVRITVHVKKSVAVLAIPLLAVLLVLSLGLGVKRIVTALMATGTPQSQVQMQEIPTQPQLPSLPHVQEMPQVSDSPATQPPAAEAQTESPIVTEPAETQPVETVAVSSGDSPILNFEQRPFLQQLSDDQLTCLEEMYQAAMDFEPLCTFSAPVSEEDFDCLMTMMHSEFPELMQVDPLFPTSYHYDARGNVTDCTIPLVLSEAEYEVQYTACVEVVDYLVKQTQGMTDWEKEKYVFDYITDNCTYDIDGTYSHSPYGTLVDGVAKCDGITLAMKWIMEEMDIRCLSIFGDPTVGDIGHAWNMIELDGTYYNVDVTMDVEEAGEEFPTLYCALNVSDELVLRDYVLNPAFTELVTLPQMDSMEMSYHVLNGSYIYAGGEWEEAVINCFMESCETGEPQTVQFESESEFAACLQQIDNLVKIGAERMGLNGYSWNTSYKEEFFVLQLEYVS